MTTKEQERQAIEKIRKIVEGLGENSYVVPIFESIFRKIILNEVREKEEQK